MLLGVLKLLAGRAHAQQRDRTALGWFGNSDESDPSRWVGGIDRGGRINCRIGDKGGNCSTPDNCVFNLSAREEHLRTSFCMHERMERPYLGAFESMPRCLYIAARKSRSTVISRPQRLPRAEFLAPLRLGLTVDERQAST